ncbi:hypothetical protein [Paracidovorax konjaci]|uniref:Uncharacterized protein n=1 Tax=Paracidovorax konjaci TaxID=32040 RepID=A0A1I1THP1_9BURK|nr:hypothetical protein [Paracidovorax konjaci]SFD55913.1 hypothetical protein SAMN04489710_103259 [Paracidovorax konjaci]
MNKEALRESVRHVIDYDDQRASAPREHALTAIAGAGLLFCALIARGRTRAVCRAALGGALLLRAAGGRDGLRQWSHERAELQTPSPAPQAVPPADLAM